MTEHMLDWEPPQGWLRITSVDAHTAGEPFRVITSGFPEIPGDTILARFPDVRIWDPFWYRRYDNGITWESGNPDLLIGHSHPSLEDSRLPDQFLDFDYLINMPILKGHSGAGVTLAFKNNFGLVRHISRFHEVWACPECR